MSAESIIMYVAVIMNLLAMLINIIMARRLNRTRNRYYNALKILQERFDNLDQINDMLETLKRRERNSRLN